MHTQVGLTQSVWSQSLSQTPPLPPKTKPQWTAPMDPAFSSLTSLPLTLAILLGPADSVHFPWSETEVSKTNLPLPAAPLPPTFL